MSNSTKALRTQTLVRRTALDKKLRRKARHQARQMHATIELVSNRSTSALTQVGSVALAPQIEGMYRRAVVDMDKRLTLKGKDRRKLNNAEFDVRDPSAGDFFAEQSSRKLGKRDQRLRQPTEGYYAAQAILAQRAANN